MFLILGLILLIFFIFHVHFWDNPQPRKYTLVIFFSTTSIAKLFGNISICFLEKNPILLHFFYLKNMIYKGILTLIQPGSGKAVNYWGPSSFDLAFTRCKLTLPSIWQMCDRAQICPEWCGNTSTLRKSKSPTENPPHPHSTRPGTGNWLECWLAPCCTVDHGLAGLSPCSLIALKQNERGVRQGHAATGFLTKMSKWASKHHFLMSCQKFKKI